MIRVIVADSCKSEAQKIAHEVERNSSFQLERVILQRLELLEALEETDFELLILSEDDEEFKTLLDHGMLRSNERSFDLLLLTHSCDKQRLEKWLRLGAIDYLLKPCSDFRFRQSLQRYYWRVMAFRSRADFSQNKLDSAILCFPLKRGRFLQKGITEVTRNLIWQCIISNEKPMKIKEIAKRIGISGVVISRYLKEMCEKKLIQSKKIEGRIGRPCIEYWPVKNDAVV